MPPPPLVVAHLGAPFPIGLVRWTWERVQRITLVAKMTFDLERGDRRADEEPLLGRADDDAWDPGDFAPRKAGVDLLLAGSARLPMGAQRAHGAVALPSASRRDDESRRGFRRDLVFAPGAPSPLVTLGSSQVLEGDGVTPAAPCGRVARETSTAPRDLRLDEDVGFDFAVFQVASPAQQLDRIPPGATVVLSGALSPGGERSIVIPPAPWLYLDRGFGEGQAARLVCDTVALDLDAGTLVVVWRGEEQLDEVSLGDVDRVLARWPGVEAEDDLEDVRAEMPRARFSLAQELGRVPDEADGERLRVALFEAMEVAGKPTLDVRTFAGVSALLAEGKPPRDQVLARHGFDEDSWTVEERAHGESMATAASYGNAEPAAVFGEAFVEAQDSLGDPAEAEWTVERHAELTARIEVSRDVPQTLRDHDLSMGAYMRIDRRISARLEVDGEARARWEAALETARAANPEPEDDESFAEGLATDEESEEEGA